MFSTEKGFELEVYCKMDGYDECFADDESDSTLITCNAGSFNHEISESERLAIENDRGIYTDLVKENEYVFDTEWALKRRYSLSSLIYSRFLVRLEDRMKTVRGESSEQLGLCLTRVPRTG